MTDLEATAGAEPGAKATAKEWLGLSVLTLVCLLLTMDIGVLYFSVPLMSADLEPSGSQLLWIMDSYGFALAGLLITMGWLGDRIGRRKVLVMGAILFGTASALAAYSTSPEMLIASRALLGIGAATLTPTTLALIRSMFHDPNQRKTAIAVWSGALTGGATLGPIIGGLLLEKFWWGSVFLINVPVMILLVVLAPIVLPEQRDPSPARFDLLGVTLSLAAILPTIWGIKELAVNGYSNAAVAAIVVGVLFGWAFIQRQRTREHPLIDLVLFRSRAFTGSVIVNLMVMLAFVGISLFTNQFMQLVLGKSPFVAALWSLAVAPAIGIAIGVTTAVSKKVRPGYIISGGLLLMTAGFIVLTQVRVTSHILFLLGGVACLAAGMLVAKTLIAEIIVTAAPAERAGSSAAVSETASEFGGALGFAVLGSVGTAVYHREMLDVQIPGAPEAVVEAARGTLGGATAVAANLPEGIGNALLATGRLAFTHGLNNAALAGAIAMAVVAVLTGYLLRNVPVSPAGAATSEGAEATASPQTGTVDASA